ncbi:hypothetical protein [Pseudoalteromonas sp. SiA1]|uniref:hypothetical protein n=1 Tax=Pseudoalteromonas sp. SiA1 TaxID=2839744 RepID=UPI001C00220F|nr:hypothetical protein [Pseudoalteromonas sp. SiA1]QWF33150.1 hypothetical protein KK487_02315 [Pseudoalteromonas sp. SiA1]
MRVLYVASLFRKKSCSASIRNVALVNGLKELGCSVSVLTIEYPSVVLDPYLVSSVNEDVNIIELNAGYISSFIPSIYKGAGVKKENMFSKLKRFVKNVIYFPGIDKKWISTVTPKNYKNYDLIISSSDTKTSHFVASKIVRTYPIKWLQIWGDPWADDVGIKNNFLKLRASIYEKKLLKSANFIGYVSLPTAQKVSLQNPDFAEKIKFIPRNFFKTVEHTVVTNDIFRIAYTGVLKGRDIIPIIKAIDSYNAANSLRIELDIFGRISPEQEKIINDYKAVTYFGEVSLQEVYEVFKRSHALLYLGNAAGSSQIPGKLYDYFGTKLPILALVQDMNDAVTSFILESKRCVVFKNKSELINLKQLVESHNTVQVLQQYSPAAVASQIIKLINS